MSGFTLKQLEYLVAAVQTGSLTGAASLCHISHAGISNGLNELERSLGTQLLVRRKAKGVVPTAAGRAMLPLARSILRDVAGIEGLGQSGQGELTGELTVGCTLALSPVLIPLIASAFAELHPNVDLVFREGNSRAVLQMVRDGQVDAGLVFQRHLSGDLEYLTVCPIRVKVALPPTHPLATRLSISLAELAAEPAITPDGSALESMLAVMREAGVEPNVQWTFASPETIRAMVARGFGYSLLYVFPEVSASGSSVVSVPVNDRISDDALVMALPARRRQIDKVDKLAEILRGDAVRKLIG
ncbi:LysR family transcriptional regulator [Pseudarthrobacter sp. H2]|uniref:LysR family transcriptional regulator n=1 Tax=Pseudarthrobacter sp. H2 TaxID=3418415 RepID=UPI003CEB1898